MTMTWTMASVLLMCLLVAWLGANVTALRTIPARATTLIKAGSYTSAPKLTTSTALRMGLFDGLFGPKKSASASHILVKGPEGKKFLTDLKRKIEASSNIPTTFAEAAAKYSACPSSKRGGALGTFTQGQMVPAFDKVVFTQEVGKIHGPVATPFGEHLILIESRQD